MAEGDAAGWECINVVTRGVDQYGRKVVDISNRRSDGWTFSTYDGDWFDAYETALRAARLKRGEG